MPYNVNDLIEKYKDSTISQILTFLPVEVEQLDAKWIKLKDNELAANRNLNDYRNHAGALLFYITSGGVIPFKPDADMKKFIPIVQNLVEKGEVDQIWLDNLVSLT